MIGAAALWGSLGVFGKVLYGAGLSPLEVASVRAAIGCVGLGLWLARRPARLRIAWRDVPFFALFGLVGIALFYGLYLLAIERTTVAIAAALLYTAPAFVAGLSRLFRIERLGPGRWLALGLVLVGAFLVTGAARSVVAGGTVVSPEAIGFGLGAALTYALFTLFGKRALGRYDPLRTVFWSFAFGTLFLALAEPPWRAVASAPQALPALVLMGVGPTIGAYLLYLGGLRHLPATAASMLATAEPVVAALLGVGWLGESLTADRAVGIGLIVVAAAILSSRSAPAPAGAGAG